MICESRNVDSQRRSSPRRGLPAAQKEWGLKEVARLLLVLSFALYPPVLARAQGVVEEIQDITGKYEFLTADDTLALLEEEGKLKGYVDIFQGEDESDEVLSYPITLGWRKKNHVEFKTGKIHQRYYRFTGAVERGRGHEQSDPDYLRLVGNLEIVTVKGERGEELPQRLRVVFKSLGRAGGEEK